MLSVVDALVCDTGGATRTPTGMRAMREVGGSQVARVGCAYPYHHSFDPADLPWAESADFHTGLCGMGSADPYPTTPFDKEVVHAMVILDVNLLCLFFFLSFFSLSSSSP